MKILMSALVSAGSNRLQQAHRRIQRMSSYIGSQKFTRIQSGSGVSMATSGLSVGTKCIHVSVDELFALLYVSVPQKVVNYLKNNERHKCPKN